MRKRLLRLSLAILALATLAMPHRAAADQGCPSHLTNGQIVCHLVQGTHCSWCRYNCDGTYHTWDTCGIQT